MIRELLLTPESMLLGYRVRVCTFKILWCYNYEKDAPWAGNKEVSAPPEFFCLKYTFNEMKYNGFMIHEIFVEVFANSEVYKANFGSPWIRNVKIKKADLKADPWGRRMRSREK